MSAAKKLVSVAKQLLRWIQSCDELHGDTCQAAPMHVRSVNQISQWVIDTEQACIVPGSSVPRYVALSYVWPEYVEGTQRLILERSNLERLQQPGTLSHCVLEGVSLVVREIITLLKEAKER